MSYDLIYAKQFIKVETEKEIKYIPIVLAGSSNCFETTSSGRERRARSWYNLRSFAKTMATEKEMLDNVYAERERIIARNNERLKESPNWDKYDDKLFGYFSALAIGGRHTSNTTFGMYRGLITSGVKKALTVEQLRKYSVSVYISVFSASFDKEKNKIADELNKNFGYVSTTAELLLSIEHYEKIKTSDLVLNVKISAIDDAKAPCLKRAHLEFHPKERKETQKVELDKYFVIKTSHGYFNRLLPRGYRYSYFLNSAKVFETLPQARKYIEKLANKGYTGTVEEIKEKITIYK